MNPDLPMRQGGKAPLYACETPHKKEVGVGSIALILTKAKKAAKLFLGSPLCMFYRDFFPALHIDAGEATLQGNTLFGATPSLRSCGDVE